MSSPSAARWIDPPGRFAAATGRGIRVTLARLGSVAWLVSQTVAGALRLRPEQARVLTGVVKLQVRFTALDALPLAGFTALLLGGITLLQVYGSWSGLGAETYLSGLLAQLVIRELGPLLVGVIVISRSGTAIATEMATMRLGGEVDTLYALGVNPFQYLMLPRILGGVISVFCLIVWFDTVALLGGFLLAYLLMPLSLKAFLTALGEAIAYRELFITFAKALVFGAAIPLLCMNAGLRVRRSTTEIPQAVTRAAVACLITLFIAGALLSAVCYG
jgi:phospholipid/cholesterol/gamma-HCH transport system permease protein